MVVKFYDSEIGYDNMMFAFVTRFGLAHLLMDRNTTTVQPARNLHLNTRHRDLP